MWTLTIRIDMKIQRVGHVSQGELSIMYVCIFHKGRDHGHWATHSIQLLSNSPH